MRQAGMNFSAVELCAGGGGQALGLEMAGFQHAAAVEIEPQFCSTLRTNRPHWNVLEQDIRELNPKDFTGLDLLAAGVPCPPFSIAGKQLGSDDDRDMFPAALALIKGAKPRGVMLENVQGLASAKFSDYRKKLMQSLTKMGYQPEWKILQAADYGVPQLRPRFVLIALKPRDAENFRWPSPVKDPPTVGTTLLDLMEVNGWKGAKDWAKRADRIAPTVVGGSRISVFEPFFFLVGMVAQSLWLLQAALVPSLLILNRYTSIAARTLIESISLRHWRQAEGTHFLLDDTPRSSFHKIPTNQESPESGLPFLPSGEDCRTLENPLLEDHLRYPSRRPRVLAIGVWLWSGQDRGLHSRIA